MQEALQCAAPLFLWSSVFGRHGRGRKLESGGNDAFMGLLKSLRRVYDFERARTGHGRPSQPLKNICGLDLDQAAAVSEAYHTNMDHVKEYNRMRHNAPPSLDGSTLYEFKGMGSGTAKHQIGDQGANFLCGKYCKTSRPCIPGDTGPEGAAGAKWLTGQCLRAPLQPWWLPWPYGGVAHY
mmetsp:Transcript_7939/g.10741  ORF Transcript_7939/g.10741 Transcript_7939/m.10741 type:complete len:181 (-) Transcript_7939:158-700(-)